MPLKDKANIQAGIVNQSLLEVTRSFECIEVTETENTTTVQEKLGIKTQLYARIDFHMDVARKAIHSLEDIIARARVT